MPYEERTTTWRCPDDWCDAELTLEVEISEIPTGDGPWGPFEVDIRAFLPDVHPCYRRECNTPCLLHIDPAMREEVEYRSVEEYGMVYDDPSDDDEEI